MTTASGPNARADRVLGALLGTAVGDALGLPREGLSARRARRMYGEGRLRHRLLFGLGMISDDTEHSAMVLQALLAHPRDPEAFARSLAWRLRAWLLALPAGVGMATARAILKLWLGFPPHRSGVHSAGNGPAMRAGVLGAALAGRDDAGGFVRVLTRVTHTDPQAEQGARAVALAAALGVEGGAQLDRARARAELGAALTHEAWGEPWQRLASFLDGGKSLAEYAAAMGWEAGITGYIVPSVCVALYAWLKDPGDFEGGLSSVIRLGGDADTTGAIAGAILGASAGAAAIPEDWLAGIREAPRSRAWLTALGRRAAELESAPGSQPLLWPLIPFRNLAFLLIVLGHGLRRLLPPY